MRDILSELNGKDYIEKLNEDYDIRFCSIEEYEELVEFIKKYWKEDHIFVLSKELLDFQHLDLENGRYNFVIAKHRESKEIHSILGFVPTNHYCKDVNTLNVWPCIWKSRDDIKKKGLGVSLYYYLKNRLDIETFSILGISEIALSIYKHWNFKTGHIEHYFMPNMEKEDYQLTDGFQHLEPITEYKKNSNVMLEKYSIEQYSSVPSNHKMFEYISKYKSKEYYLERFCKHPIYTYDMWAIVQDSNPLAIMITRVCQAEGSKCLRVVDYIGDIEVLQMVQKDIYDLLVQNDYEYIDFIEVGLNDQYLKNAGFLNKGEFSNIVIPNYFEPFVKKNVDLDYAYKTVGNDENIVFYKADADQDRPNYLKGAKDAD